MSDFANCMCTGCSCMRALAFMDKLEGTRHSVLDYLHPTRDDCPLGTVDGWDVIGIECDMEITCRRHNIPKISYPYTANSTIQPGALTSAAARDEETRRVMEKKTKRADREWDKFQNKLMAHSSEGLDSTWSSQSQPSKRKFFGPDACATLDGAHSRVPTLPYVPSPEAIPVVAEPVRESEQ